MRIRTHFRTARVVLMASVSALLLVGPIGCGSDTASTGTSSELPPEAVKANNSMQDFENAKQKK